jgi:hypothetical protein
MICTLQYAALFCVLGCPNHAESLSWDRSVGSRISFLFSKYFFVYVCVAQLERFVDDTTFQKSNSPRRSKSGAKNRSGSVGSAAAVVGLGSSSDLTVDYPLVQTLTDEQDSYLS